MTDSKDRLIELILNCERVDLPLPLEYQQHLADHLLANGVIVPPCKVGQTVYVPSGDEGDDVVEVVRCKDCIYAVELDKHCDISRTAYRHCSLLRGDETKYVWHKYKKYYKSYSIVDLDGYCDSGELKEREG